MVGRLFEGVSLAKYLELAATEEGARLTRVRDPFARLLVKGRTLAAYSIPAAAIRAAAEE